MMAGMKRFFMLILCVVALFAAHPAAAIAENGAYSVVVNGEYLEFDQQPVNVNGRLLVPVRAIFESLGAEVTWDNELALIISTRGDTAIKLQIDCNMMALSDDDGFRYEMLDAAPILLNNRTLVPLRAIASAFSAEVVWDDQTQTATITLKGKASSHDRDKYDELGYYSDTHIDSLYLKDTNEIILLRSFDNEYVLPVLPSELVGKPPYVAAGGKYYSAPKTSGANRKSAQTNRIISLDYTIDAILADIIDPEMTEVQMIKAVYDYIAINFDHGHDFAGSDRYYDLSLTYLVEKGTIYFEQISDEANGALTLLYVGKGVCDHFANLFTCMLRRLGFEVECTGGIIGNAPHAWNKVLLDGVWYYCDTDLESRRSTPSYAYFLKSLSQWEAMGYREDI